MKHQVQLRFRRRALQRRATSGGFNQALRGPSHLALPWRGQSASSDVIGASDIRRAMPRPRRIIATVSPTSTARANRNTLLQLPLPAGHSCECPEKWPCAQNISEPGPKPPVPGCRGSALFRRPGRKPRRRSTWLKPCSPRGVVRGEAAGARCGADGAEAPDSLWRSPWRSRGCSVRGGRS
jgi:hypothetical protein